MKAPIAPQHIQNLKPYLPGRSIAEIREETGLSEIIKLASNENPLGASPLAVERMKEAAESVATYPRAGLALREKLASRLHVELEEVITASGSEGVLLTAMRSYLEPGNEVITADGTFIGFYVIANAMNLDMKMVPLTNDYTYDLDAIANVITDKTRLIYIANPNNPTGTAVTRRQWHRFLDHLPENILVILDEAYSEYAQNMMTDYPDSVADCHPQVLTLRTFSKAYGLAGVRIGYGVGHRDVIGTMLKVKLPFEPTVISEAAGLGALDDRGFLEKTIASNSKQKARLESELDKLGLPYTKSVANFSLVICNSAEDAAALSDALLRYGIIARPMVPFRLPHCVRITIGNEGETTTLIKALREIVQKA